MPAEMISESQHPSNLSVTIQAHMKLVSAGTSHIPLEKVVAR